MGLGRWELETGWLQDEKYLMEMQMKWRLAFPLSIFLLGTDSCVPMVPEKDPVVSSDAKAVAALRAEHGEVIALMEGVDKEEPVTLALDGAYVRQLSLAALAVPGGEALLGARIQAIDGSFPGCDSDGYLVYSLELSARPRPRRGLEQAQVQLAVCVSELADSGSVPVELRQGPAGLKVELLGRIVTENTRLIFESIEAYERSFEIEQHRILGERLGCPETTGFRHSHQDSKPEKLRSYWCAVSGERHGPFIEGELDPFLNGVRRVEGHYDHGVRDGHWIVRDESGEIVEESWWSMGTKAAAPETP